MKLDKIWMVTKPKKESELVDVCAEIEMEKLYLQYLGGLREDEVVGFFTHKEEAVKVARALMRMRPKVAPPENDEAYQDAAGVIARGYAPEMYPCKKCGWPVIRGFTCTTCGDDNPSEEVE